MIEFRMPSLGADMTHATLVAWRVKVGDVVHRGDVVAEIEADKGVFDAEIYSDGRILELVVQEGDRVPVGAVMARLEELPSATAAPSIVEERRRRVTPLARRMAEVAGLDLAAVRGTGPEGAVTRADVERAVEEARAGAPAPAETAAVPAPRPPDPGSMRRAIASAMSRSKREAPHYYLETRIDMSRALAWMEAENVRRPVERRLLPTALLIRATALALHETPDLNGHWTADGFAPSAAIHVGLAIALRSGGLVAPAIRDADRCTLDELMERMRDLIARARSGQLRSGEMTEATITLTSLGDLGVDTVFGIIHPPQAALVGTGRIREEAWAENGMLGVRRVLHATLSGDHRVSDGRQGARFLTAFDHLLQEPEHL